MSQLPTPDSELSELDLKSIASLNLECLDTLLERYLCLLDQQQKLQTNLAQQLSSGFFFLAQANFSCPPGRRYGPDYYDERMKATRNISIESDRPLEKSTKDLQEKKGAIELPDSKLTFSVELIPTPSEKDTNGNGDTASPPPAQDTPPESPEESTSTEGISSPSSDSSKSDTTPSEKPETSSKKFRSSDPIHWYGILVPQSLRKAQASFAAAIDKEVPDLASITVEMRTLEQQISKLRAQVKSEPTDTSQ